MIRNSASVYLTVFTNWLPVFLVLVSFVRLHVLSKVLTISEVAQPVF